MRFRSFLFYHTMLAPPQVFEHKHRRKHEIEVELFNFRNIPTASVQF
jgi:hypothetical protein